MDCRFDHLHLKVADPDGCAARLTAIFAARMIDRRESGGSLRCVVAMGGVRLFIDRLDAGSHSAPAPPFRGIEHLAVRVDDIAAFERRLAAHGGAFTIAPTLIAPGLTVAFMELDGAVNFEVIERAAS